MNVMTEDEAKGKWCPFARVKQYHGSANRALLAKDDDYGACLASGCAAWRWGKTESPDWWDGNEAPPPNEGWEISAGDGRTWVRWPAQRGYCGLAGSPTP